MHNKKRIERINNNNTFSGPSNKVNQSINDREKAITGRKQSTKNAMWQ